MQTKENLQLPWDMIACWNRSLSAELSGLTLGKTSRYNVRMVHVSCPLLRDIANAAQLLVMYREHTAHSVSQQLLYSADCVPTCSRAITR